MKDSRQSGHAPKADTAAPSNSSASATGILVEMTIDEVRQLSPEVVVIPVGSTEPHGPHLPYGTDTYQVEGVARRAVVQANMMGARALLYPTLPVSNNVNFQAFPFACRVSVRTLMLTLLDIIESLEQDGIRKIILLNGHGGNVDTIRATIREHIGRHRPGQGAFVCMIHSYELLPADKRHVIEHPSDHGGEAETSRMMYLQPDLVRTQHLGNFPMQQPDCKALADGLAFYVRPWHGYVPVSAGGETRASSAAKGQIMVEEEARRLAQFIAALSTAPMHDLFPYAKAEA